MANKNQVRQATQYDAPRGWRLWHHPDERSDGWECLLYSDAQLLGQNPITTGPFTFFVTGVRTSEGSQPTGQVVLRIAHTEPVREEPGSWTLEGALARGDFWLGLGPDEELAALLSLALDIRLRSGSLLRRFPHGGDPAGAPEMHNHHAPGLVPTPPWYLQMPMLSGRIEQIQPGIELLERYARLQPTQAFVLAKAARHYSDALWIADSDSEQAWLQLVNALEVVAVQVQTDELDPTDVFREAYPKAAQMIEALDGGTEALPKIAKQFTGLLRAGRRFRDFVTRYAATPPESRPEREAMRFDWAELDGAMNTIYGYRSALLHDGKPFPPAMVDLVPERDHNGVFAECPRKDGIHAAGRAAWDPKSVPMHLSLFADITRRALLAWWLEQADGDA